MCIGLFNSGKTDARAFWSSYKWTIILVFDSPSDPSLGQRFIKKKKNMLKNKCKKLIIAVSFKKSWLGFLKLQEKLSFVPLYLKDDTNNTVKRKYALFQF